MKEAKLIIDGKEYTVQMKDEDVKAVTKPKTGYEIPMAGQGFYTADANGEQYRAGYYRMNLMLTKYNDANCYTNEQLAKDIARADRLYRRLRQWQALNDKPVNYWNDSGRRPKYSIFYSHYTKSITSEPNYNCEAFGTIHFSSSDVAEAAIKEFKDELTWYFTEFKQRLDE